MYPVTQEFNSKILDTVRQVFGRVQIDYTDPFIDQSITAEASENANISYPRQTADGVSNPVGKVASLDGSWVLDGTYKVIQEGDQIGWWGKQLSDSNGNFINPYPTLAVFFNQRPLHSFKVVGDKNRGEYPVDFSIRVYNEDILLHNENVYNNNKVIWEKTIEVIPQVTKLELEITKWSHPNRQVKILEFFTSVQGIYEGEDIISINLLEERDTGDGGIPVGNITSNEITVTLNNKSRIFDVGNTQSPLNNLLKPNRRIQAWLGIEKGDKTKEFVPLGMFWGGDWDVPEDGVTAKVVGRDRFKFLEETVYENKVARHNMSLYDLAIDILIDAGSSENEYWVDPGLKDYVIPYVKMEAQSHREALRKVANACLGQVYCNRQNIIRVEGVKTADEFYEVSVSENANVSYPNQLIDGIEKPDGLYASLDGSWILDGSYALAPEVESLQMGWWGNQLSDSEGNFSAPYPKATLNFLGKAIEAVKVVGDSQRGEYPVDYVIKVYDIDNNLLSEQKVSNNTEVSNTTLIPENPTNATKIEVEITKWSHAGRQAKLLEIKDVPYKVEITPEHYFRKNNPAKYSEMANYIEVIAQPVDNEGNKLEEIKVIVKDDDSIVQNGLIRFPFPSNLLIQTESRALEIANTLLENFKDPKRSLKLEWRGNPALLLGDIVSVIDKSEKNDYKVIRQELEYAGYLRARLSGRRM